MKAPERNKAAAIITDSDSDLLSFSFSVGIDINFNQWDFVGWDFLLCFSPISFCLIVLGLINWERWEVVVLPTVTSRLPDEITHSKHRVSLLHQTRSTFCFGKLFFSVNSFLLVICFHHLPFVSTTSTCSVANTFFCHQLCSSFVTNLTNNQHVSPHGRDSVPCSVMAPVGHRMIHLVFVWTMLKEARGSGSYLDPCWRSCWVSIQRWSASQWVTCRGWGWNTLRSYIVC